MLERCLSCVNFSVVCFVNSSSPLTIINVVSYNIGTATMKERKGEEEEEIEVKVIGMTLKITRIEITFIGLYS